MHTFAPGDAPLNFVSLQGPHVVLRVKAPALAGERHIVARFQDDDTAKQQARDLLRSAVVRLDEAMTRFLPESTLGIDLPDGRLYALDGVGSNPNHKPTLVFAKSPAGTQFGAVLDAVIKGLASGTVALSAPDVSATPAPEPMALSPQAPPKPVLPPTPPAALAVPAKPAAPKSMPREEAKVAPDPVTVAPQPQPPVTPAKPAPAPREAIPEAAAPKPPVPRPAASPSPARKAPEPEAAPVPAAAQQEVPTEDQSLPAPVSASAPPSAPVTPVVNPKTGKRSKIIDAEVSRWRTIRDNTMRVQVNEFTKGRFYVDFRRWYEKDGQLLPSKGGVRVTAAELDAMEQAIAEARALIAKAEDLDASGT